MLRIASYDAAVFCQTMPTLAGYSRCIPITISHAHVGATLANFPLCVKITANTDIGAVCQADGDDIRFVDSTGWLLSAERESFSVTDGAATGVFWVNVQSISATEDTVIYLFCGNPEAAKQDYAYQVWGNYLGVYHFGGLDGNYASLDDSSYYSRDGTLSGAISNPTGSIGQGAGFDGSSYFTIPKSKPWSNATAFTASWWGMLSDSGDSTFISCGNGASYDIFFAAYNYETYFQVNNGVDGSASGPTLSPNTWYHFAVVFDGSQTGNANRLKVYINGVLQTLAFGEWYVPAACANIPSEAATYIGEYSASSTSYYRLNGKMDEVHLLSSVLSEPWIVFEYYNQLGSGQITFGAPDAPPIFYVAHKLPPRRPPIKSDAIMPWATGNVPPDPVPLLSWDCFRCAMPPRRPTISSRATTILGTGSYDRGLWDLGTFCCALPPRRFVLPQSRAVFPLGVDLQPKDLWLPPQIRCALPPRRPPLTSVAFCLPSFRRQWFFDARGLYRIFNEPEYRFYRSQTGPPSSGTTPFATSSLLPNTSVDTFADGTWYLAVSYFNGVLDSGFLPFGDNGETYVKITVSSGEVVNNPPAGPSEWSLSVIGSGVARITALHYDQSDGRADQWAISYTVDGSDPAADNPTITADMAGSLAVLSYDLPAADAGATVSVRLQTRRNDGTDDEPTWAYSESTVKTITIATDGPSAPVSADRWPGPLPIGI